MHHDGEEHLRSERVGAELERGDDAEVAAAPAKCPHQVRVLLVTHMTELPVDRDDVGADETALETLDYFDHLARAQAARFVMGDAGSEGRIEAVHVQ